MKLTRAIALALGIALLWRQLRFERAVVERVETDERHIAQAFEDRDHQSKRWSKELLREVERAFKHAGPLPLSTEEAEHHRQRVVARAMFAPLDPADFHPSGSQMDEAARVIDLIERSAAA